MTDIYCRRVILADICRRARAGGDWKGYAPVAFENKKTDTQWYLLDLPWAYVVAFRGTEPNKLRDWATDLAIRKKVIPYGNGRSKIRVHSGFLGAYKSVRGQVHITIKQRVTEHKPVVVVGHSLGGALATLCAVDLQYQMQPSGELNECGRIVYVFTFGSPRVGNRAFQRSYIRRVPRTWRYWGWFDIVVMVPPWLGGYRHVTEGQGLRCTHNVKHYIRELEKAAKRT